MTLRLQCGHAEFGVENQKELYHANRSHRPSMRPRRIRRGERVPGCYLLRPGEGLQCGHAEFGVENLLTVAASAVQPAPSMRPRRIRRGEPAQLIAGPSLARKPSMRPRRIRRGEPRRRGRLNEPK